MLPRLDNPRLLRLATSASVAVAAVLILAKLGAWLMTGSVSVLASLIDSLMDGAASLINLIAVRYSLTPADEEHRFGHGNAQALAGLAQATFIAGSALFLVFHAVDRLLHPQPLAELGLGMGVMLFAVVITLGLVMLQRYVIARTHSPAIRADSLHYVTDLLTNLGTIIALLLAGYGWQKLDPLFAIVIASYIFYSAGRIGLEAFQHLMDRELPAEIQQQVLDLALGHPEVRGVHDLRTRQSGHIRIIQLHLELDADLSLYRAHAIADEVTDLICRRLPDVDLIIHQDPAGLEGPTRDASR